MIRAEVLKHFLGKGKSEKKETKGHVRRGSPAGGTVKNSRGVRVIDMKDVAGDNPIEYLLPNRV